MASSRFNILAIVITFFSQVAFGASTEVEKCKGIIATIEIVRALPTHPFAEAKKVKLASALKFSALGFHGTPIPDLLHVIETGKVLGHPKYGLATWVFQGPHLRQAIQSVGSTHGARDSMNPAEAKNFPTYNNALTYAARYADTLSEFRMNYDDFSDGIILVVKPSFHLISGADAGTASTLEEEMNRQPALSFQSTNPWQLIDSLLFLDANDRQKFPKVLDVLLEQQKEKLNSLEKKSSPLEKHEAIKLFTETPGAFINLLKTDPAKLRPAINSFTAEDRQKLRSIHDVTWDYALQIMASQ